MFWYMISFCKRYDFPWKIVNDHFFWQTKIQTGEWDKNGLVAWHDREYFTTI